MGDEPKRPARLRRSRDVRRVLTEGGRWQDRLLVLRALPSSDDPALGLAVVVGGGCGGAARRNLMKRWVKESVRQVLHSQGAASRWWMVIIARPSATACAHSEVHSSLERLLREAGIVMAARSNGRG